jgi:hypothetical protein
LFIDGLLCVFFTWRYVWNHDILAESEPVGDSCNGIRAMLDSGDAENNRFPAVVNAMTFASPRITKKRTWLRMQARKNSRDATTIGVNQRHRARFKANGNLVPRKRAHCRNHAHRSIQRHNRHITQSINKRNRRVIDGDAQKRRR